MLGIGVSLSVRQRGTPQGAWQQQPPSSKRISLEQAGAGSPLRGRPDTSVRAKSRETAWTAACQLRRRGGNRACPGSGMEHFAAVPEAALARFVSPVRSRSMVRRSRPRAESFHQRKYVPLALDKTVAGPPPAEILSNDLGPDMASEFPARPITVRRRIGSGCLQSSTHTHRSGRGPDSGPSTNPAWTCVIPTLRRKLRCCGIPSRDCLRGSRSPCPQAARTSLSEAAEFRKTGTVPTRAVTADGAEDGAAGGRP